MSSQQGQARGRARATARGKPPQQPQGRGAEPRRPGPPAGGPSGAQAAAPKPQASAAAGRASHRTVITDGKIDAAASSLSQMTVSVGSSGTNTSGGNGNNGNGSQPLGRGAMRGRRPIGDIPAELISTRPEKLVTKKGVSGTPIKVLANYFKLSSVTHWQLFHYDVKFNPEEDRIGVKKGLIRERLSKFGGYLFDGNSLFMSVKIPTNPLEFVASRYDDEKIHVTIKFTNDLQPSDFHYLQVFGILVRKCLYNLKLQLIGRNYFDPKGNTDIPQYKLSLWPGYVNSIRQHEKDILLCAEITTKVMRQDTALDVAYECNRSGGDFKALFQKMVIGVTVMTTYNDRNYKVTDVDFTSNPRSTFDKKDGSKITFADYFNTKYNVKIRDLGQPMLVSKSKPKDIRSGEPELVYLVPELCRMTGLTDEMVSNISLMRAVADITRVGPQQRIARLMKFNQRLLGEPEIVKDLKDWGMKLDTNLVQIDARLLPINKIIAGNNVSYTAGDRTDWTNSLRANPMLASQDLQNWAIVSTARDSGAAKSFVQMIIRAGQGMRFRIAEPAVFTIQSDRIGEFISAIDSALGNGPCSLIMCIFPNNKADRYAAIKKKCYVDRAVPSQVVLAKTCMHKNALSIATKVAIQLNCKLGGAPWTVPIPIKGLMVIGFDVCHDSAKRERSYGAMVASLNNTFSRYYSSVSEHKEGNEMSNDLALSISKALRAYKEANHALPERLVIYRDGVGDGQIPQILETEVATIKKSLLQIYGSESLLPKLVFVVVTKRINTRIFTMNSQNPNPGTIVDDVITTPTKYDFFLVSQTVRQGTVSPTSYNVIYDEADTTPEQIQRLTYAMTHMYYNCSSTVRVPAPTQYAHKLAFLVGQTLHQSPSTEMQNLLYFL